MCKRHNLQRGRHRENSRRLLRGLHLGVDDKCKPQLLLQVLDFLAVVGHTHTRDCSAAADALGNGTAQKVQFISLRHGDQQVRLLNPGLHQYAVARSVADDAHDIIVVGDGLDLPGDNVDDRDIMSLVRQLFYKSRTYISGADDDNLHSLFFVLGTHDNASSDSYSPLCSVFSDAAFPSPPLRPALHRNNIRMI